MVLGGRYAVGRVIGHGGMAEVYLAEDTRLNRTVAVKILRSDLARDASFQERFRREAQSAAALNHPAIVAVYDTGEERSTTVTGAEVTIPYIVMEYVAGSTLREHIDPEHPMSEQRAAEIMSPLLSALEYSHRAGIVHRDIKPGNVMITEDGKVTVMDFGIARAIADATSAMTATQAVMGTAQYLSPEQARGQLVDARSDIYSSACVMYEMLTGRPPFTGDSPVSIAYQHVREEPQAPSTFNPAISPQMDAVILTGLAKDREDRYPTAAAFAKDIAAVVRGQNPQLVGGVVPEGAAGEATTVLSPVDGATEMLPAVPVAAGAAAAPRTDGGHRRPMPAQTAALTPHSPASTPEPEDEDRRKTPWWLFALIAAALIAVVAAALFFLRPWDRGPEMVAVPDVVGMAQDVAIKELKDKDLRAKVTQEASTEVAEGEVISSDPAAGAEVAIGATVNLVVSAGPEPVEVPDLTGKTADEARQILEDLGLTMTVAGEEDVAKAKASTVTRFSPQAGATTRKGSTVEVWLATGNVKVPDVKGLPLEQATKTLESQGFVVESSKREDPEHDPGTVVEQTPASQSVAAVGSSVQLVVAAEVGPTPMPNVIGRTEADARKVLEQNGWGVQTTEEASDTVPKGRVIRSEPEPDTPVARNATVKIVVSKGPEAPTTPPETGEPSEDPGHGGGNGIGAPGRGNNGGHGVGRGR